MEVRDRGVGMSMEDIERGWLTVSASRKREMKKRGEKTEKHSRTPLGDKGLGRLGAQRLGKVLELRTRRKESPLTLVTSIFWDDFEAVEALSRVPISVAQIDDGAKQGTTIVIRGLNSTSQWNGENPELQRDLADMISPYSDDLGFKIRLKIDNRGIDLRRQADAVLDGTGVTYTLHYERGVLKIRGRMNITYLRPDQGQDKIALWNEFIAQDNGFAFLDWLIANEPRRTANLQIGHGDDKRFCTFETDVYLSSEAGVELLDSSDEKNAIADPGPFEGRVDLIQRRHTKRNEVFDSGADFSKWIDAVSGVRLYRNGFGIRLKTDWLKLASQWTKATSYYTIRPENVMGYINLTAEGNAALEETSNREDMRDTPAYRNFQRLLARWLSTTESFQSVIRRGYNDYLREKISREQDVTTTSSPRELAREVSRQFDSMAVVSNNVAEATGTVSRAKEAVRSLQQNSGALSEVLLMPPEVRDANDKAVSQVAAAVERMEREFVRIQDIAAQLQDRRGIIDLLARRLEEAEQQVNDVWDLVSLGITAESVAHEVLNITDRLTARSVQIARYNDAETKDRRVAEYVEHVRASSRSMAKQVSHLDSSLRYVRDQRDQVRLSDLVSTSASYFNDRWTSSNLSCEVAVKSDFSARLGRGKFSQVLDNLLLNSEFWMKESVRSGVVDHGHVTVEVQDPFVLVYDNGRGIDPSVEELIFDPFVTRKPGRLGRGLGLFVVRQLLDSDGASISLDLERNTYGNRFRFRIDLRAVAGGLTVG
nr:HAMP domain-containing sensor histidine kinase [Paenarthrobacter ilicis]